MKWFGPGVSVLSAVLILLFACCLGGYLLVNAYADIPEVTVTIEYDVAKILGVLMGGIAIPTAVVGFAKYRNPNKKG